MPLVRNFALHKFTCGDMEASIPLLHRLLAMSEETFRPEAGNKTEILRVDPLGLVPVLRTLGYAYLLDGDTDQAKAQYERAFDIFKAHSGSLDAVPLLEHVAMVEYYAENFHNAQRIFVEVISALKESGRGERDPDVLRNIENAATAVCRIGPRAF